MAAFLSHLERCIPYFQPKELANTEKVLHHITCKGICPCTQPGAPCTLLSCRCLCMCVRHLPARLSHFTEAHQQIWDALHRCAVVFY